MSEEIDAVHLVGLLCRRATEDLKRAKELPYTSEALNLVIHAQNIILELHNGVDDSHGELSKGLVLFFEVLHHNLMDAVKDENLFTANIVQVLGTLEPLTESWENFIVGLDRPAQQLALVK